MIRCLTYAGLLALCLRRRVTVCLLCVLWTGHAWCTMSLPELVLYLPVGMWSQRGASGIQVSRPHHRRQGRGDSPSGDLALDFEWSLRGRRGHLFPTLAPIPASLRGGGGVGLRKGKWRSRVLGGEDSQTLCRSLSTEPPTHCF